MAQPDTSADQCTAEHADIKVFNKLLSPEYFTQQPPLDTLLKQLEADGLAKVKDVKDNKGTIKDIVNIIENGTATFEKTMGRPMTYSEIRAAYG